jgi:acyl transferase domain-containing protein
MGPYVYSVMTGEGILSPEGSCKTFDASADGFARAEGINAVYLKRLPDALRDGNPIRAIIRNSGNNSDGKSQGILSPSSSAQEALMRHVYTQAHLNPAETGFIEFHGTGTPTGDPIEATAVANLFGEEGIHIGSVSVTPTQSRFVCVYVSDRTPPLFRSNQIRAIRKVRAV